MEAVEWAKNMTPYDFSKLQDEPDLERAIGIVFDEAHDKWADERSAECLTEGQITVLVVETYFGEVMNGEHYQYFSNESGGLANFAPAVLRRVGLDEFVPVVEAFIALFPDNRVPEDAGERQQTLDRIADEYDDEFFERLESQFFELCPGGYDFYRKKLFAYILSHEDQFVTN